MAKKREQIVGIASRSKEGRMKHDKRNTANRPVFAE